jgi:non-homologous end joining protein Ku
MAEQLLKIAEKKKRAGDDVVKISAKEAEESTPVASGNVLDLMERLKQSLKTDGASESPKKRATRKTTRKKRSRHRAA